MHRPEPRIRIQRPGAADVDLDRLEQRRRLDGRELEGDGPTRLAPDGAQFALDVQVIDFDHHAVNLIIERFAAMLPLGAGTDNVLNAVDSPVLRIGLKTPFAEGLQHLPLGPRLPSLGLAERINEHIQRSPRGNARVELANRSGGAIARVGEQRQSVGRALVVDLLKSRA